MIQFGSDNPECGKISPGVLSCREIFDDDSIINGLEIIVKASADKKYRILFKDYILHLSRNESFTAWDDYEVRRGNWFIVFEKSRLLDMFDSLIIHTEDWEWPGKAIHYGIYTWDSIIDVISTERPTIDEMK